MIFCAAALAATSVAASTSHVAPLRAATATLLPNGWTVTPAGRITPLGTLPLRALVDPSDRWVAVANAGYGPQMVAIVDARTGAVADRAPLDSTFYGLAFSPDGRKLFASGAGAGNVASFDFDPGAGRLTTTGGLKIGGGKNWISGIALSPDGSTLYAADGLANLLVGLDVTTGLAKFAVPVGEQPYGVAVSGDGRRIYVSDWADAKVVAVSAGGSVVGAVPTGGHPNALVLSPDGRTLYVACANDNVVDVVDTGAMRVRAAIDVALYPHSPEGATPDGVALSPDGRMLYVADADADAIVAVSLRGTPSIAGALPVGWYPTDVAVSRDGKRLFVVDGKGTSGHANAQFAHVDTLTREQSAAAQAQGYVAALSTGDLEIVDAPNDAALAAGITAARANSPYRPGPEAPRALPPIAHVIFIIKENRTYDEVLGDDPRGNGAKDLAIFGRTITPNAHALARSFALLDNFETEAEVSADGHNWSVAAYATDYVQKLWPSNYSQRKRPYDFEGQPPSRPAGGYIWDAAIAKDKSVRVYGEYVDIFVPKGTPTTPVVPALEGRIDPAYRGFDVAVSDQERVDEWLREFKGYVASGALPSLEILRLPDDHTAATKPGARTPFAMVASNDYALGRIVDAVSHSRYWRDTIIMSVEDDAQAGPDHIDDQRTLGFIAGGYVRRGVVDHQRYTTAGMLHTIELLLGLTPMSQFDAGATPLTGLLSSTPNLRPYNAIKPSVDLSATNPGNATDARMSQSLALDDADRADPAMMTRILFDYAANARRQNNPAPATRAR